MYTAFQAISSNPWRSFPMYDGWHSVFSSSRPRETYLQQGLLQQSSAQIRIHRYSCEQSSGSHPRVSRSTDKSREESQGRSTLSRGCRKPSGSVRGLRRPSGAGACSQPRYVQMGWAGKVYWVYPLQDLDPDSRGWRPELGPTAMLRRA